MRNVAMNIRNYLVRKEAEAFMAVFSPKSKKEGSAIIETVIVVVVVVVVIALAIVFKKGGIGYLEELWTYVTTNTKSVLN